MTRTFAIGAITLPLVLLVAAPAGAQSRGRGALDPPGLARLQQDTGAAVTVDPGTGAPKFVRVRGNGRGLVNRGAAVSSAERNEHSRAFFRQHANAYGLSDPDAALQQVDARGDRLGWTHHTYRQVYRGVPVFGGEVKTHFDPSGQLVSVSATVVPEAPIDTTPSVSRDAAAGAALARVAGSGVAVRGVSLYVFRTGLAQGVDGSNHLAWEVEVGNGLDVREFVYVDAHSARIIDQITGIHDGLSRRAYDGRFLPNPPPEYPGTPFWVEGDPFPTGTTEADNMIVASKETYDFFMNAHGRDSFDGAGATMDSIFNRGYQCPNASWNGTFISFCQGLTTDDVTGHEWGHAYTQYTHGLIYQWQSGALNESYSDIWGEIIDQINGREGVDTTPTVARTVGTCSTSSPPRAELVVNAPASIAGTYPAQSAAFGPALTAAGVTGDVVVGDDGVGAGADGCEPLVNDVAGKIVLVDRGTCNFTVKVKNAQDAGAIAVMIANNAPTGMAPMGGADATITIPSIGTTQADGQTIRTNLPANVTLRSGGAVEMSIKWLMGEDSTAVGLTGALRDMWDPTCEGNPGRVTDTAYYTCSTADGGGVHSNSGVPNHAFALLVDGGTYNGQTVSGIGLTKAAHIYYRAASVYQTRGSNFIDHADALEQSCADLTGQPLNALTGGPSAEVISAADCGEVADAVAATELRTPPDFCNFQPLLAKNAPDRCEAGTTQVDIFADDFESDPSGTWQLTETSIGAGRSPRNWEWVGSLPDRPGSAFFGVNADAVCTADDTGVIHLDSPEIELPSGVTAPRLTFDHWISLEAGWDGGQILLSVDGGAWQQVHFSHFTFNPYRFLLFTTQQGNTNPMAGQAAFTSSDGGTVLGSWGRSHVNLAPYAGPGQSVRLRFDVGNDYCTGMFGWYVDDVTLYACTPNDTPTASINDVAVVEGNEGVSHAVFTVSLSHASAEPVTVKYRIHAGTAKTGRDFIPADELADRTLVIPPLSISGEIPIRIRGDVEGEPDETFTVTIEAVSNATIDDGSGTATILNDDSLTSTRR
jgi:Zn-dependent metalloprotease